jgi:hypothetical protein
VRKITQVIASALGEVAATLTQIEIYEYDGKKYVLLNARRVESRSIVSLKHLGNKHSSD